MPKKKVQQPAQELIQAEIHTTPEGETIVTAKLTGASFEFRFTDSRMATALLANVDNVIDHLFSDAHVQEARVDNK